MSLKDRLLYIFKWWLISIAILLLLAGYCALLVYLFKVIRFKSDVLEAIFEAATIFLPAALIAEIIEYY